jgi:hypothetical protein
MEKGAFRLSVRGRSEPVNEIIEIMYWTAADRCRILL